MTIKNYFEPFILYKAEKGCIDKTVNEYKRFIKDALFCIEDLELSELRVTRAAKIQSHGRKHGYWGEMRAVSVFLQFIKYLEDNGESVPFRSEKITLPKTREREQDFMEPEDFEYLVSKLPNTFYGLRDRTLYELLWSTGLRIGEALKIDIKDINFDAKEIKVHTAKGGQGEKVYISERAEYWLKDYLAKRQDDCEALFINFWLGDVKRLDRVCARKRLSDYRRDFGITKKLTHPSMRSGYCTNVLNLGANIKEVQYLARHRSERTTLKFYTKVTRGRVKEVHQNIFNNLMKKRAVVDRVA